MHDTWRWWLRGIATYPQRTESNQFVSQMQEVTSGLIMLDRLLWGCLLQSLLFQPEPKQIIPRKRPSHHKQKATTELTPSKPAVSLPHPSDIPLQVDMFSGQLRDTRTDTQKKADSERIQPHQQLMFSQRDIAQFGVNPRPQFSLPETATLMLMREDPRTEEEKEHAQDQEARRLTRPLFEFPTASNIPQPASENEPQTAPLPPFARRDWSLGAPRRRHLRQAPRRAT